jgi:pilus assembly protein TadC
MKPFLLIYCLSIATISVFSQDQYELTAQKGNYRKVFEPNERVKVKFNFTGSKEIVVGRIESVNSDSIFIRGLRKRSQYKIAVIAIKDIEKIKNIYTGSKTSTGLIAMLGAAAGTFMLSDVISKDAAFFPDASVGMAVGVIATSFIPYIIVTLSEPSFSENKQYTFKSVLFKK